MSVKHDRNRRERGFVLVLLSLTLVGLLAFAAFAIDLGALYNHRRLDQNAADAAALAAVQELGKPESVIVATAKEYAHDTLGHTLDDAAWDSCEDDPALLEHVPAAASCISYNTRRVRVRIPDQEYATTFGAVVGSDSFRHGAFAIAGIRDEGGVLPYAVTGPSADGGFGCLQSNSNGQASSWCGSTSGNFGFLDFSHYGNPDLGTTLSCGSGAYNARVRNNTAMGVDHDLSLINTDYSVTVVDAPNACQAYTPSPNAAYTKTGNQADDITEGLFYSASTFPDGGPSRLRRVRGRLFDAANDGNGDGQEIKVFDRTDVDNNALWRFIPENYGPQFTPKADIPTACQRNQFVKANGDYYLSSEDNPNVPNSVEAFLRSDGLVQPRDRILGLMARCFAHYMGKSWSGAPVGSMQSPEARPSSDCVAAPTLPCTAPVFALNSTDEEVPDLYDIQYTPRFGYVPQIANFPTGTSAPREFIRFRPIFIYRLLFETPGGLQVFDPGVAPAPPASGNYNRVGETSVFVFPDGMLPGGLAGANAPFDLEVNRFIRLIR